MIKTWFNKLILFLDIKSQDFDLWLKWILGLVVLFHFLNISGLLWTYSVPRTVLMGYDEDSSYGVETAIKTNPINHNGSTTYGPLYYRLTWPAKIFLSNNYTNQSESNDENLQRTVFFTLLTLNLLALFAACFMTMRLFTPDIKWQFLGTSLLVSAVLQNEYRNLILFMAKPDYVLCFFVSLGAFYTFNFINNKDQIGDYRKMAFFWACALSTKLTSILFLPGFIFVFFQKELKGLLKSVSRFAKHLIVFYFVIGFPQNLDIGGYLKYLRQQSSYTSFVDWNFLTEKWIPLFYSDLAKPILILILLFFVVPYKKQFLSAKKLISFLIFCTLPTLLILTKKIPNLFEWYTFPFVHVFLIGFVVLLVYLKNQKYFQWLKWINPQEKSNRILLLLAFVIIPSTHGLLPIQTYERYKKQLVCRTEIIQVKNILDQKMSEGLKVLSDPGLPYDLKFHNVLISPEWDMSIDFLKDPNYKIIALKKSYYNMYLPAEEGGSGSFVGHIQDKNKPYQFYKIFSNQTEITDPYGNKWKKFYSDSCSYELWQKIDQ